MAEKNQSNYAGGFQLPNSQPAGYPPSAPAYPQQPPLGYPQQPGWQQKPNSGFQRDEANYGSLHDRQSAASSNWMNTGYGHDSEQGMGNVGSEVDFNSGFNDKAIRRGFIRKVYGILMCQLLLTGAFISIFTFVEDVRLWAARSSYIYWIAFVIMIVCLVCMACCESVRRKFPGNIICLGIFTIAQGFMLGTMCARFDADAILMAVGICAAVSLALSLFAFQTKYDFTTCGGMLCAVVVIFMIAGIIMIFVPYNKYAMIGYASVGALIFSMYIVYDTQLMMGGKHKYSLDPEEYIFAALNIYMDIINLFLYILMIIGAARSD